ncbi:MFS transporter [Deferrisoma camini]|uniref:MFS transporter n=1 Tax=Deferrisoma camini TaxID=1035120 RepID=UPI00146D8DE7|nr:MFS transporter [Deferrisoma camini]
MTESATGAQGAAVGAGGRRIHRGWIVLGSVVFVLFALGALRFSYGVLFRPMLEEFGWTRAAGSWAYSVNMVFFALTLPVSGLLYDRVGPRRLLGVFGAALVVGVILSSYGHSLWQLVLGYGVLAGVGFGGLGPTLLATVVGRWFASRTGTLMSLGFAGIAAGQLALLTPVAWATEVLGWRWALRGLGLLTAVAVGAAWVLVRDRPEDLGLSRVGSRPHPEPSAPGRAEPAELAAGAAMASRGFWVICAVFAVCGFTDFLVDLHVVPLLLDRGGSLLGGGTVKAVMGAASFFGVLLSGWLSDRVDERVPLAASFALRVAIFAGVLVLPGLGAAVGFAVLYGFSFMASAPITAVLVRNRYGVERIALLTGVVILVHHASGGLGAFVGGAAFDRFGSYRAVLALALGLSAAAAVLSLAIPRHRPWTRQQNRLAFPGGRGKEHASGRARSRA